MAPSSKKSPTVAEVSLVSLKNCLVNLPQSLVTILESSNVSAQDVIVEILIKDSASSSKNGKTAQRSVYTGWSGMPTTRRPSPLPASHSERGFAGREVEIPPVEIDATFGRMLGLENGQRAGLLLHSDPPLSHTVNIEPLTPGDWEIIELHANFLELNLLSQIRALPNPSFTASPSQQAQHQHPLTLHLSPTSTASIIVSSLMPPLASSVPFAKIAADAEVIVAPKTRPRMPQQNGSRSIASIGRKSAGGRSGKSGAPLRKRSEEEKLKTTLLLRPCDRKFCQGLFDDDYDDDDEEQSNLGLKVWVDSDIVTDSVWKGVTHALVSVIKPARLELPLDQQQQQKRKEVEVSEAGKPASTIVAKLVPWYDAVDSIHAALSSPLCSALMAEGIVGGMVKIEAVPPPMSKTAIENMLVVPFILGNEQGHESIKFSSDSQAAVQQSLEQFNRIFNARTSNGSLMDGPLTDGMYLAPVDKTTMCPAWPGGILRFAPLPRTNTDPAMCNIRWTEGSKMETNIKFGNGIPNPFRQPTSAGHGIESIADNIPQVIGIDKLVEQVLSQLSHSSSVLLTGGLGSGKSFLAQVLGHRLRSEQQTHVSYIWCHKLSTDEVRVSMIKEKFERQFMAASWAVRLGGHALVVMDDLDKLCPTETELQTQDNGRSRQISELLCNMARQYCGYRTRVTLLATSQNKESVNGLLVGANLFKEIVTLKAPDKDQRRKLLQAWIGDTDEQQPTTNGINPPVPGHNAADQAAWMDVSEPDNPSTASDGPLPKSHRLDLLDIAGQTDGYMPADLSLLVSRAKSEALIRLVSSNKDSPQTPNLEILNTDFQNALKGFTPASLRSISLHSSTTTFSSIGGLHATRRILLETLQYPTLYAPIFAQCPLRLRSGILLYGYPGCGKTLLASAVAGECGLNFISVKGPEILNKYIGASEKSVRDLFERAESARPCVLFFDEFDSIAPKRGHDSTGVTDRVVNQLLTQMDGAEGLQGVYVLAATSRPDLIDPALLRPGRLDKSILCDLPGFEDRLDILRAIIGRNLKVAPEVMTEGRRQQQRGLYEVAGRTEGYSGADLQAVVYNAHLEAIHDQLGTNGIAADGKGQKDGRREPKVSRENIFRFRFGVENDGDAAATSTHGGRAQELVEYNTIVSKLEDLKKERRVERRRRQQRLLSSSMVGDGMDDEGTRKGKGVQDVDVVIQWRHIEASLATTRSSISAPERERLGRFYREFVQGRNGEMLDGEGSTEVGGRSSLM
ncbi:MAG: hypothetical protein LQ339_000730 [Xanthoria mediterranea]|nr:MAG: hypothetical protein LQ339_000730 [Xanthoria mediterranea]